MTMKIIAVICKSQHAWIEWANARQPHTVNRAIATGEDWTAHRCESFDVPWQGIANEIVILPTHGGFTDLFQAACASKMFERSESAP